MERKTVIMDENAMNRAVARITYEILEHNKGTDNLCLVGLISRGIALAERIKSKIFDLENVNVSCGALDITPYRDDIKNSHACDNTKIDFEIKGKRVVIVDDVLYTGRSIRAAIDALIERGRPEAIQLAVLIDRGHREIPIRPDYVGKNLPTSRNEEVMVSVREIDGNDCVEIFTEQRSTR